jgi:hypothetical protein
MALERTCVQGLRYDLVALRMEISGRHRADLSTTTRNDDTETSFHRKARVQTAFMFSGTVQVYRTKKTNCYVQA